MVGTDHSDCAKHALDRTLELMAPDDKLFIFHAAKFESFAKRVEVAHQEIVTAAGRKATFVFDHVEGTAKLADVLCEFAFSK